jgi:putative ABC transport system permease protein
MLNTTPLARKTLTHNLRRLLAALAGVGFAVVLMFMQTGFRQALYDSTVKIITDLDADLLLVNSVQHALPARQTFPYQRILQAGACPGVMGVYPLYIEFNFATLKPEGKKPHPIRVIGFHLDDPVFLAPEVRRQIDALRRPNTALIDQRRKAKYDIPYDLDEMQRQRGVELADREVRFVGAFPMGTDFANDGNIVMSAENFAQYFPFRSIGEDPLASVDMGVVKLQPGADPAEVQQELRQRFAGTETAVYTKHELIAKEKAFWAKSTPIGYIFGIGTIMGFVVGVIICYQVIYSGIADQMAEFATLKAMGYRNRYFVGLVLQTAFYLSVISYVPGLLVGLAMYGLLASGTGLLLDLTLQQAVQIYAFTLGMCVLSGCLAMRKVLAADPADLF